MGLFFTGFVTIIYAITILKKNAKYTSIFTINSAIILQLVALFDEVYAVLHGFFAVLFFLSIWSTALVNTIEKKSLISLIAFFVGLMSFALYEINAYNTGIAVPEIISFGSVASIIQISAIKAYLEKQ